MNITWKWAKSLNHAGTYTDIDEGTAAIYTPKPADLNHYLRATATYTDPQGSDKTEMVISAHKVLAPRSTNTAPVFKDADGNEIMEGITREVAENSAAGTDVGDPVEASDGEGDVLTYTLGGAAADSFDIDVATGQLRTKASLNTEEGRHLHGHGHGDGPVTDSPVRTVRQRHDHGDHHGHQRGRSPGTDWDGVGQGR